MITIYTAGSIPPFLKWTWLRPLRAVWTAEELGLPYTLHRLDAVKGEQRGEAYLAVNPFGKIPSMKDGDFTLFESGAIVTYLADKAGKLIPAPKTRERAIHDQWCFAAVNTIEPPVFDHMFAGLQAAQFAWAKERAPQLRDLAQARLKLFAKALGGNEYLTGKAFTVADALMGQVLNFVNDPGLFDGAEAVRDYHARVTARPAYQRALKAIQS